jgi:hypothetical protein
VARCSEDAIKDTQKKHKLPTRTGTAGATLLNLDDLVRVGRVRAEDLTAGGTGAECAELAPTKEQVSQLRTEVGRQGGRLVEREAFLDLLRQQVAEKDRQIRGLQRPSSVSPPAWPAGCTSTTRPGARHPQRRGSCPCGVVGPGLG